MQAKRWAAFLLIAASWASSPAHAITARYAHATTLLPDGNVLVTGGALSDGSEIATVELVKSHGYFTTLSRAAMNVARASHTATLLPNGEVLVVGGRGGATASTTAEIFNPIRNCWRTPTIALNNTNGRYNHTATLLRNGDVLVCGGQQTSGLAMAASCEKFTSVQPAPNTCSSYGSFTGGITMLVPRALHTATLLDDGRVFMTGGMDTTGLSVGGNGYLVTSEIYNPAFPTGTLAAHSLIQARAYHRASLMGNGKVLIVGGHSAVNQNANRGYLDTTEIYDPILDHVTSGGQIPIRVEQQSQIVRPSGVVTFAGGLGNITTTYYNASQPLPADGILRSADGVNINAAASALYLDAAATLSVPVSGDIEDGFILYSFNLPEETHSLSFAGGNADLAFGSEDPVTGVVSATSMTLAGVNVSCPAVGGSDCGKISVTRAVGISGTFSISDASLTQQLAGTISTGTINYSPSPLSDDPADGLPATASILGSSSFYTNNMTLCGFPSSLVGSTLYSAAFKLTGGSIVFKRGSPVFEAATIAFSDGDATIQTATVFENNGSGCITSRFSLSNLAGTVSVSTHGVQNNFPSVGLFSPLTINVHAIDSMGGEASSIRPNQVILEDDTDSFAVDVATIVIRKMLFGDYRRYDPPTNAWEVSSYGNGGIFGMSATLMPNGNTLFTGGRFCLGEYCQSYFPFTAGSSHLIKAPFTAAGAMASPRYTHTSTLLPSGKILLAGGSNGPNSLYSAELFDPVTQTLAPTGDMTEVRDLHTATMLPNGRVLVAGGFTTNAVSTGPTDTAEIYQPEAGRWYRTASMTFKADKHTATLMPNGNVLVAGGTSNGSYLDSAAIYITTAAFWQALPAMPAPRAKHSATLLQDGRVLIVGGINQFGVLCSAILYDPALNAWVSAGNVQPTGEAQCTRMQSHSATQLLNGQVLIAGGTNSSGDLNDSFLYQPPLAPTGATAASWTRTVTPLNWARFDHTAMLLPNGNVLIAGGAQLVGSVLLSLSETEEFDIFRSSWGIGGALQAKRASPSATIGADGRIYVFGGNNGVSVESTIDQAYFTDGPDVKSLGVAPGARQSSITAVDIQPAQPGNFMTLTGRKFLGVGEAAGGEGPGGSSHHNPRLMLQSIAGSGGSASQGAGSFTLDVTTRIYSSGPNLWANADSSITIQLPGLSLSPGLGGMLLPYGWYHLRAYHNAIYSESKLVQVGPALPVGAPSRPSGEVLGRSSITWTWDNGTLALGSFDGYEVYSSSTGVLLSTHPATAFGSFTQTDLGPASPSSIRVAAYTGSGPGTLMQSDTYYTNPIMPTNVRFSSVGYNSLTINWDTNGNVFGTVYEVYQSTDINFSMNITTPVPKILANTGTSADISFLATNTTYYYQMRAFNGSDVASDFTTTVATRTRTPVLDIAGFALDPTTIQWNWIPPGANPNSYEIYNATSGALIASIPGNNPVFLDTNLGINTQRCVRVSAITDAGEGPLAQSATVYTLAAVPGTLSPSYDENSISTSGFVARWTANGNPLATDYRVQILDHNNVVVSTQETTGFSAAYTAFASAGVQFSAKVAAINGDGYITNYQVLGSSSTRAARVVGLVLSSSTSSALHVSWDTTNNSSSVTYQVTYSTDNFATTLTAIAFSAKYRRNVATISGVITSSTYSVLVQAQNYMGVKTALSNQLRTSADNGCSSVGLGPGYVCRTVDPDVDSSFSGHIGLSPDDREFTLRISPGTFPGPVFIIVSTLTVTSNSPCANGTAIGFSITANPHLQPLKAMPFTFGYDDVDLLGGSLSRATLQRADPSGACAPLTTLIDRRQRLMSTHLNHFSNFQVGIIASTTSPEETRIFPNPFFPSRGHGFVTFQQMPAGASVKIFTMRGELVFEGNANNAGLMTWLGVNRWGRPAASGVYLAVVESDGEKKVVKLVVVR